MSKDNSARYRLITAYYLGEARFDKTKALELAGYMASSRENLRRMAQEIFKKEEIKRMIEEHVRAVEISQDEILKEYAELARMEWREDYEAAKTGAINAKAFDTAMRLKITALAHLMKVTGDDLRKKIEHVKAAFEQHRKDNPSITDEQRIEEFKQYVDVDMMKEVVRDLLESDENRRRLEESEKEINRTAEFQLEGAGG